MIFLIRIHHQAIHKIHEPKNKDKKCIKCSALMYGIGKYCYTCKDILADEAKLRYQRRLRASK